MCVNIFACVDYLDWDFMSVPPLPICVPQIHYTSTCVDTNAAFSHNKHPDLTNRANAIHHIKS